MKKNETNKKSSIIRKIIYLLLFTLIIMGFLAISKKYASNHIEQVVEFKDYYPEEKKSHFQVINGNETVRKIKKGHHIIFIGNSESKWSVAYAKQLNKLFNNLVDNKTLSKDSNIYYYDLANDKYQKNSKYYDIRRYLKGALVTIDDDDNNLLTPVLYIVKDGQIEYYNIDTVAMKNKDDISDYWTEEQELMFEEEITEAIQNYYLNK